MLYIDFNELDYDYERNLTIYQGAPFSGIAYEKLNNGGLEETFFKNGIEDGLIREWYPNGKLHIEKHMHRKKNHGIYWEWDTAGELIVERIYEFGILVKELKRNETGENVVQQFNADNDDLKLYRNKFRSGFGKPS